MENLFQRKSGVLLHPTSLPNTRGVGTLGKEAYKFIDWLEKSGQQLWQILPLGPTSYGDSPYASVSSFAGNPYLIDLDWLVENNLLQPQDIDFSKNSLSYDKVDYEWLYCVKLPLLFKAAKKFLNEPVQGLLSLYQDFSKQQGFWLNDYALFMSIKKFYDVKAQSEKISNAQWNTFWPKKLAKRDAEALAEWQNQYQEEIDCYKILQFFFYYQWNEVKNYANKKNIKIIGDIPIFVALDSVDVWANQKLFQLDKNLKPLYVAGVPPDYFSATGQLWGNPLYDWQKMKKTGFTWWIARIKNQLSLVDYIRIDHFRGFESYWAIPFGNDTAIEGTWQKCPGKELFAAIKNALGESPIIAEDLGVITPEVENLRDSCGFPGMKILQFAFDSSDFATKNCHNPFLPHEYAKPCVVYTGTHDNDTTMGFLKTLPLDTKEFLKKYLHAEKDSDEALCKKMIQSAYASRGNFAIIPLQDIYCLPTECRMNTPSKLGGNWLWRFDSSLLDENTASWLEELTILYGRNT
ncbi:MAG: 4-alpha-glucanotransferase [Spirochaetaceae bacterium]|nr:4-alpha-glucanotransferase [Spirochaetaceae bacterium]